MYIAHLFVYAAQMEQRTHWWWNGRWGRLARLDVKIYSDGEDWQVDLVNGGVEGRVRQYPVLDEQQALTLADQLKQSSDGWRDMTGLRAVKDA